MDLETMSTQLLAAILQNPNYSAPADSVLKRDDANIDIAVKMAKKLKKRVSEEAAELERLRREQALEIEEAFQLSSADIAKVMNVGVLKHSPPLIPDRHEYQPIFNDPSPVRKPLLSKLKDLI